MKKAAHNSGSFFVLCGAVSGLLKASGSSAIVSPADPVALSVAYNRPVHGCFIPAQMDCSPAHRLCFGSCSAFLFQARLHSPAALVSVLMRLLCPEHKRRRRWALRLSIIEYITDCKASFIYQLADIYRLFFAAVYLLAFRLLYDIRRIAKHLRSLPALQYL